MTGPLGKVNFVSRESQCQLEVNLLCYGYLTLSPSLYIFLINS